VPRTALRSEPLVHFALVGLLLFGAHALLAPATSDPLVVDRARVDATAAALARRLERPATPAEIAAALRTELDEDRLYHEALALGLDRDDPIVRRRLIQKLRFVHEDLATTDDPDDAALLALRDADPARYTIPERLAVTHVLAATGRHADPRAAASALRERLLAGEPPAGLGDPCVHGQRFAARTATAYAGMFGGEFAAALADMPDGTWSLVSSSFGWHVVRVDARTPPTLPELAALRPRLRADWEASRRDDGARTALAELRARRPAVLVDVPPAVAAALAEAP
jgi:hypothetical protein